MTSDAQPARSLPSDPDPDDVFEFSASAINTWSGCKMKYGHGYFDGLRPEGNASAKRGQQIHREIEDWLTKKIVPADATAKRLLPLNPLPTHPGLRVEHPFRILFKQGAARGFIDLLVSNPILSKMPKGPWRPLVPVIFDQKSTGRMEFAKTSEDLRTDPQAILYGVEARRVVAMERKIKVVDVPEVDLCWNYGSTKTKETRPVHLRQSLAILEDGLGPLLETVSEMAASVGTPTKDLDYDLRECDRYGGCAHRSYCPAHQSYLFGSVRNDSFPAASDAPNPETNPERTPKMANDVMAKLRKLGAQPAKPPPPEVLEENPPAKTASDQKVTPEPDLPKPDVAVLDEKPIPPGTSPVNPPDAAPNVSPEDPPAPEVLDHAEIEAGTKKKRGRPKGSGTKAAPKPVAEPETIDAEFVAVPLVETKVTVPLDEGCMSNEEIDGMLARIAQQATDHKRLVLAAQVLNARICLQGGG